MRCGAEVVPIGPVLDDLAVGHPEPVGLRAGELLACCREDLGGLGILVKLTKGAMCRPDMVARTAARSPSTTTSATSHRRSPNMPRSHRAVA